MIKGPTYNAVNSPDNGGIGTILIGYFCIFEKTTVYQEGWSALDGNYLHL